MSARLTGGPAFAPSGEAGAYVPNAGAEQALAVLGVWSRDPERPVLVLGGAPGTGKTMLQAVLAERVGRSLFPVRLSAAGLDPDGLARQVLDALGPAWEGPPRAALAKAVAELSGRSLLLLVDDADALPPRTEMWLFDFVRRNPGAVRVLLAVADERLAGELAGAFRSDTPVCTLQTPLTRAESDAWVQAELTRVGVGSAVRARFDDAALARLHLRSRGIPGQLRIEAAALAAEAAAEPAPRAAPIALAPPAPVRPSAAPANEPAERAAPRPLAAPTELAPPAPAAAQAAAIAPEPPAPVARTASTPAALVRTASPPAEPAARQESLLRWLLLPGALAAAFVAGFVTAHLLEALRGGAPELATAPVAERSAPAEQPPAVSAPPPAPVAEAPPVEAPALAEPSVAVAPPAAAPAPAAAEPTREPAPAAAESATPPSPSAAEAPAPAPLEPATPEALATAAPSEPAAAAPAPELAPEPGEPPAPAVSAPPPAARRARPAPPRPTAVSIQAEPGARVSIDGRPIGSGPVATAELEKGPHRIVVELPDGRVVERVIDVRGTRYDVNVR